MTRPFFKPGGEVVHRPSGEVIGGWRKEPDPHYTAGTFRVWLKDEDPDQGEGKTCYPRYMGCSHFSRAIEEIEMRGSPEP